MQMHNFFFDAIFIYFIFILYFLTLSNQLNDLNRYAFWIEEDAEQLKQLNENKWRINKNVLHLEVIKEKSMFLRPKAILPFFMLRMAAHKSWLRSLNDAI